VAQDIAFGVEMQGLDTIGRRDDFDLPTRSLQAWTVSTKGGERFWPAAKEINRETHSPLWERACSRMRRIRKKFSD